MHLRIQSGPVDECVLPDARVFLQVGADTRQVVTAGDAERLQRRTWSDAGTQQQRGAADRAGADQYFAARSEEHTSELQSLMRISYAVFCLKKKKNQQNLNHTTPLMQPSTQIAYDTYN